MPKKPSVKKGAAAQFQNWRMVERAKKETVVFGAVLKKLGNRGFTVKINAGTEVMATVRKLYSKGNMPVGPSSVVIIEGTSYTRPWEIVAVVEAGDAHDLVSLGRMPEEVMRYSAAAGSMDSQTCGAVDDIFEREEESGPAVSEAKTLRDARRAAEHLSSVSSRVAALKGGRSCGLDGSVKLGDLGDVSLLDAVEYDLTPADLNAFKVWRTEKRQQAGPSVTGPSVSAVMAGIAAEELSKKEAADQAAIIAQIQAAEAAAELKEWFESRPVKENWDDEEEELTLEDL